MESKTINKIDAQTQKLLVESAERKGISLNKLIKNLLKQSLGVDKTKINKKEDFKEFFGVWSEEEFIEFRDNTSEFSRVDVDDSN
ncbi:MAG: hypothetical protein ACRENO_03820 [Thermodesulfobacteriota bacterium]